MITLYDVLRKPLLSEKAMSHKEKDNAIVFQVHPDSNKTQISKAVESFFGVKVQSVRTMNIKGKVKRFGKKVGKRKDWKKAIVCLKKGEKLDFV